MLENLKEVRKVKHIIEFTSNTTASSIIETIYDSINESEREQFDKILKHCKTIENYKDKIEYLEFEKIEYLRNIKLTTLEASGVVNRSFHDKTTLFLHRKLEIEIDHYKQKLGEVNKPLRSTNAKFEFDNKFNSSPRDEVYTHFYEYLVVKKIITEDELKRFLKAAFELRTPLIDKIAMKDAQRKAKVYACFHTFSNLHKSHRETPKYVQLLTDNFVGYEFKNTSKNWSTYDTRRDVI